MSVSKYNHEGYLDPTVQEAFTNIETEERKKRFRPIVYICSPYSGDVKANTEKVKHYCRYAVADGYIPLAPHLFFPQFMNDDTREERDLALFMDIALLTKCAELWVFGSTISRGMAQEIAKAESREIPIRYFDEACQEVAT